MKFACVELHTKTGKIWDGAKEKPNYLCDPKVIDTGSFGGWTSALKGEHIPLLWFKLDKPVRNFYHTYIAPNMSKFHMTGYRLWNLWINRRLRSFPGLDYVQKFDAVLVTVYEVSIRETAEFVLAIKKLQKRPIILGALGHVFAAFREAFKDRTNFRYFKIFVDNCDLFINWGHEAISEYLKLHTDTPVVNFPMFYPFEFAKSFFKPRKDKKKIVFVSGHTRKSDHVLSLLVAKEVQSRHPEFLIETIGHPRQNLEPLKGTRFRVIPFLKWIDYLKYISTTYFVIDMDNTWTAGRVPNDAAAVGTPCVGVNSGNQARLFPNLTCVDMIDIKKAVALGIRLIEDTKFYERVQTGAFKRLEKCSYENSVKRLQKMLENPEKSLKLPTQNSREAMLEPTHGTGRYRFTRKRFKLLRPLALAR